eukprot:940148-Alexandrium_andersonii.AAC.1
MHAASSRPSCSIGKIVCRAFPCCRLLAVCACHRVSRCPIGQPLAPDCLVQLAATSFGPLVCIGA